MSNIKQYAITILKTVLLFILEINIVYVVTYYLGGLVNADYATVTLIVLFLALVNALLWPVISYFSLRFIVFTLGLGTFLIDGLFLVLLSNYVPGLVIEGWGIFSVPLLIGVVDSILLIILGMDNKNYYFMYLLKKILNNQNKDVSDKPGFIFLEIDGLSKDILEKALKNGDMPTLNKWIKNGSHNLTGWETDLSSQTSASQAGILHGNNDNIPAFRWVEKENGNKIVSSNSGGDASRIESNISDGNGLLSYHGASRANLFSGDAEDTILTFSDFNSLYKLYSPSWYYFFFTPFITAKIMVLVLWDFLLEFISRIRHLVLNIKPRLTFRGLSYYVSRAGANVVVREMTTISLIGDIYSGQFDTIYATYMGYDEIAHHSGIDDYDAFYSLKQIDKQFGDIENAINESKRDYNIIILSDHGQSNGPTFKQKYGLTLNDLVEDNLPDNITVHSILHSNDDHFTNTILFKPSVDYGRDTYNTARGHLREVSSKFKDALPLDNIDDKRELLNNKIKFSDRLNNLFEKYDLDLKLSDNEIVTDEMAQTIVLASGNLGLIYFTDWSNRLTYEQIEDAFPDLITSLANHPGIGFIMVNSYIYGTMVMSGDNVYYLDDDTLEGEPFLDKFGKNVVEHLKRTDKFDHVPDILVSSDYDEENDEVYAFEELIGSHGGVGGTQQKPFILYPSDWSLNEQLIGSIEVHKFFKKELLNAWNKN